MQREIIGDCGDDTEWADNKVDRAWIRTCMSLGIEFLIRTIGESPKPIELGIMFAESDRLSSKPASDGGPQYVPWSYPYVGLSYPTNDSSQVFDCSDKAVDLLHSYQEALSDFNELMNWNDMKQVFLDHFSESGEQDVLEF